MTITGAQIEAARQLLGWSRDKLAAEARLSTPTVIKFEAGKSRLLERTVQKIQRPFIAAGVEFVEGEPGVRLKAKPIDSRNRHRSPGL